MMQKIKAKSLARNLIRNYGVDKAAEIYIKMRKEKKGPFAAGKKYGTPLKSKKK